MKYISTRGGVPSVTFREALLTGLAGDGGLYVPQYIPTVTKEQLQSWAGLKYPQLAEKVLRLFISEDEIPTPDLADIVKDCFASFHHPDILPINQIGPYNILEMWHGPTGAFKDLAFALFGKFANYFLEKQGKRGVALVGTLGDTGSAAIHSFKDLKSIRLVILFPQNGCHKLQRLQMTTSRSPYLRLYSCDCPSDDFDTAIMSVLSDKDFSQKYNLLWVNGINAGRFIFQTVHYFYAYLQMCPNVDRRVNFYIPSGGFANSAGGYQAQMMGLPINIVSVVNENDCFCKCLNTGRLERPLQVVPTHSSALDTVFPHNIERILFMLSKGDTATTKSIMDDYYTKGVAILPQSLLDTAQGSISCQRVTQEESLVTAKYIWDNYQYALCPHSAVGAAALRKSISNGASTGLNICLATATGAKFPSFVGLYGDVIPTHPCVEGLESKEEMYEEMKEGDDWEDILRQAIVEMYKL